jgi:uncharacterized membrane protein YjfL (UPF0719 family)
MTIVCYYKDMKLTERGNLVVSLLIGAVFGIIIGVAYILQYG